MTKLISISNKLRKYFLPISIVLYLVSGNLFGDRVAVGIMIVWCSAYIFGGLYLDTKQEFI
jgi:hypothetical protein